MEEIIEILMRRDGITYEAAMETYLDTKSELYDAFEGTSCLTPEDVLAGIRLETDYIHYFI